jgi:mycofactocin system glycosyltransferase
MRERTYRLDRQTERHGRVVIGGSPLRLFRLTDGGVRVLEQVETGGPVPDSALVSALLDAGAIHPLPASSGPFTPDDVTVVVPTLGPPAHVPAGALVVDDGSQPPVTGAAIRLDTNRGPGAARNAGLHRVTTPLVAFVDADVAVSERWLDDLLGHFDDERVALVAPRVVSPAGPSSIARYDAGHSPLDLGEDPARVRPGSRVSYVPAAAIVARTDVIRAIGGFDEAMRFGEDVDLVWRLDEGGWRIRYEPGCTVTHAPRPNWPAWFRQRVGYGSSAAPLSRRHRGALAPIRMSGWSLAAWVTGVGVNPVVGVAIAGGSAAALVRKLRDVPPRTAFGLAWRGNLHAGSQIGAAIRRTWWPLLALAACRSRLARRALLAAAIAPRHPIVVLDDLAYSIGVWRGMRAERTAAPIVPDISSWPGRRSTSPTADGH